MADDCPSQDLTLSLIIWKAVRTIMLGAEIPDLNLFMMCGSLCSSACSELPLGYSFRLCQMNELETWKALQIDDSEQYDAHDAVLSEYIEKVYAPRDNEFFDQCVFICNSEDRPVGTCLIWKAYNSFSTIHWLKVLPQFEGKGLGRAILSCVLKELPEDEYPVFLHTQPSSYRAIKLYSDLGFKLLADEVIGYRKNDIAESMPILKEYLSDKDYQNLKVTTSPPFFLEAVMSSTIGEF